MSAFDLVSGEADARLRDLMRQPESVPGTFSGFWGAVGNAMVAAPLESARALSPVLDAYGKSAAFAQGGAKEDTIDRIGENDLRAELTPAINRLTPDPRVSGAASQLVFGFGKVAWKAIGYSMAGGNLVGAALFGLDEGVNETMRLEDKGADTGTAAKAGAVHGVVSGVSALLPVAGKTKLQTAGIVVAGGPASYVAEQASIREILRSAQYDRIAEEYKPFDPTGLAISTVAPAVFGTVAHLRMLRGEARGIRNNNPGNIEKSDIPWNGKLPGGDARFETFTTAEQGIAALAKNLLTYQARHGLDTVQAIVERWAPPSENKTGPYVAAVAKALDVAPGDRLDLSDPGTLTRLTKAIIRQENGKQPYSDAQIEGSVRAAIEGRAIRATPEQADAARVAYLAAHADSGNLGRAGDIEAANAHIHAIEEAARMLDDGEPINVSHMVNVEPGKLDDAIAFVSRTRHEFDASAAAMQTNETPGAAFVRQPAGIEGDAVLMGDTPEQRAFHQSLIDQPNKEIPTGELDETGRPIVRPAVELMDEAKLYRMKADEQVRGIDAAVHCLLRG